MTNKQTKVAQFNEFFSIDKKFNINITKRVNNEVTSFEQFLQQMPLPFKLASEITTIDQNALHPIKSLSTVANQLVEFLNLQSQKIALLVTYILSQQDEEQYRYQGIKFGGGGIVFSAPKIFVLGDILEMKIFLLENNCAIFCYGEVIAIDEQPSEESGLFEYQVIFHFIREEDREVLVRTSLHEQSKQLQNLAKKRHQQTLQ